MNHADTHAQSPWVIDLRARGLTKRDGPGLAEPLEITAPAPDHTDTPVLKVDAETPARATGRLESVAEGVLASVQVTAAATGACSRCLDAITVPLNVTIQELFAYPDSFTAETTARDEIPLAADDTIDLAPLVHDELVLAMPTIPVCRPGCPGLCSECGERLDDVGPDHRHETIDPRWAALADLAIKDPADSDSADVASAPNPTKET